MIKEHFKSVGVGFLAITGFISVIAGLIYLSAEYQWVNTVMEYLVATIISLGVLFSAAFICLIVGELIRGKY